jgi:DNA modification methylase
MTYKRKEVIGDATLYLGDCLEVLPILGLVSAVVTDPPYGIGEHGGKQRLPRNRKSHRVLENLGWDKERPPREVFEKIFSISRHQLIWGGNYFTDYLPPRMGWLYWDKKMGGDFSDGELAFTSRNAALKSYSKCNKHAGRVHPTQKPTGLMEWCISFFPDADTFLDPFMGSGTTGVACVNLRRKFIGIEIEEKYFDIACERIVAAYAQGRLFT